MVAAQFSPASPQRRSFSGLLVEFPSATTQWRITGPKARARSSGRELAPLRGTVRSINPALRGRAAPGSLRPPPAPLSQASGVRGGAWKLIPEPAGNETTPQAGTLATGQANTQGGGRRAPGVLLGGESLVFILAHTPPTRRRTSWW